jgi:hypothetical protein
MICWLIGFYASAALVTLAFIVAMENVVVRQARQQKANYTKQSALSIIGACAIWPVYWWQMIGAMIHYERVRRFMAGQGKRVTWKFKTK